MNELLGARLSSYLLGCNKVGPIISQQLEPTGKQAEIITCLSVIWRKLPSGLDDGRKRDILLEYLFQIPLKEDPRTLARIMHEQASGTALKAAPGLDELEAPLALMSLNAYAVFLLSTGLNFSDIEKIHQRGLRLSLLTHRDPSRSAFCEAALRDPILKRTFGVEREGMGPLTQIYRNTGRGGQVQLSMLPEALLQSAWRNIEDENFTPTGFASQVLHELRLVRDVLAGCSRTIQAKLAFAGVLMPSEAELRLGQGVVVRPVRETDRRLAPAALKAQITSSDASGNQIVANYDGDVVLEYDFPYVVRAVSEPVDDLLSAWPSDMRRQANLELISLHLRFSLMMSVQRDVRAQLIPTWCYFAEPLDIGPSISWNDPRDGAGFSPMQLTVEEVVEWGKWYERLTSRRTRKITLAMKRVLRAIAERREPSDVLIDSVIAWENLFGSEQGEPTLRVTASLAILLEDNSRARRAIRMKLGKIYRLRSKIVHGNRDLEEEEYPLCYEALEVAISAIRILVVTRTDILDLPDGAERSMALFLRDEDSTGS